MVLSLPFAEGSGRDGDAVLFDDRRNDALLHADIAHDIAGRPCPGRGIGVKSGIAGRNRDRLAVLEGVHLLLEPHHRTRALQAAGVYFNDS